MADEQGGEQTRMANEPELSSEVQGQAQTSPQPGSGGEQTAPTSPPPGQPTGQPAGSTPDRSVVWTDRAGQRRQATVQELMQAHEALTSLDPQTLELGQLVQRIQQGDQTALRDFINRLGVSDTEGGSQEGGEPASDLEMTVAVLQQQVDYLQQQQLQKSVEDFSNQLGHAIRTRDEYANLRRIPGVEQMITQNVVQSFQNGQPLDATQLEEYLKTCDKWAADWISRIAGGNGQGGQGNQQPFRQQGGGASPNEANRSSVPPMGGASAGTASQDSRPNPFKDPDGYKKYLSEKLTPLLSEQSV